MITRFATHQTTHPALLILGAGGLGQAVAEMAQADGKFEQVAFLDDQPSSFCRIIGPLSSLAKQTAAYTHAIAAFGNNTLRAAYTRQIKELGFVLPTLIHPSASISPLSHIAPGCIVREKVAISHGVTVEEGCLLNMGCLIDHNCYVGAYSHIPMGAIVRNAVRIAPESSFAPAEVIE